MLNANSGSQFQIQSPGSQPFGVSYGFDNTLWWSDAGSSDLTGYYFSSLIVQRLPGVGDMILAGMDLPVRLGTTYRARVIRSASSSWSARRRCCAIWASSRTSHRPVRNEKAAWPGLHLSD